MKNFAPFNIKPTADQLRWLGIDDMKVKYSNGKFLHQKNTQQVISGAARRII